MGIQPIDLQTMYSQATNVAKTLSASQQTQLTESMQQQTNIQRNLENTKKVHQTSNEKSDAQKINQNGSGSETFLEQGKKKKDDETKASDYIFTGEEKESGIKNTPSYLGNIIDISR